MLATRLIPFLDVPDSDVLLVLAAEFVVVVVEVPVGTMYPLLGAESIVDG